MSSAGRSGAKVHGTHFQGPLLGNKGVFDDLPLGAIDNARSPYKIYYEDFQEDAVDAQLETQGWTVTAINTPTAASEVVLGANRALLLDPGSKVDSGSEIQFNIPATAASVSGTHRVIPEIIQTATLFDNQEIFFQVRMGTASNLATANDGKWLLGYFVNDTDLLSSTTGLPTVDAGGGFGFHKGETGAVTALSTEAAITAAGTALSPAVTELALVTNDVLEWHTYAARCRVIDASAGTGQTDFWYDGVYSGSLATVPFDATDTSSFTIAYLNGPVQIQDYHIDYILTGITRPGLTWPYTDGTIY